MSETRKCHFCKTELSQSDFIHDWQACARIMKSRAEVAERELAELKERTRWIPVSERLPRSGQYVLFYDATNKAMHYGWHTEGILQWSSIGDLYFHDQTYTWITRWQPLPEPPEAENE